MLRAYRFDDEISAGMAIIVYTRAPYLSTYNRTNTLNTHKTHLKQYNQDKGPPTTGHKNMLCERKITIIYVCARAHPFSIRRDVERSACIASSDAYVRGARRRDTMSYSYPYTLAVCKRTYVCG